MTIQTIKQYARICVRYGRNTLQRLRRSMASPKPISYGITREKRDKALIVSLTSYPKRIESIRESLVSLLNQSLKPDMIILWVSSAEFTEGVQSIPRHILELQQHGLTIKEHEDDLKSYLKLLPALSTFPDSVHVTADDDTLYAPEWLRMLYENHLQYPDDIICHRAHAISLDKEARPLPYRDWQKQIKGGQASILNFATGVGGVLYPARALHEDVIRKEMLMKLAPHADDIWFWAMAVLNGKKIRVIKDGLAELTPAFSPLTALFDLNYHQSANDGQMKQVCEAYPALLELLKKEQQGQ